MKFVPDVSMGSMPGSRAADREVGHKGMKDRHLGGSSQEVVRGLDPWPTTYTTLSGKRLRLFAPEVIDKSSYQGPFSDPGIICRADREGLLVTTGDGYLLIKEIQAEGSRRMGVDAYISGNPIEPGTLLGQ